MMKKILGAVAAAALITTVFAGCSTGEVGGTTSSKADGSSETKLTGTLTMAGSTSMTDVCTALNEAFMKKNSGVKVVLNGGGSGAAITALGDGSAQVGNLSRAVKDSENADGKYEAITIALDGIAVVVGKDNAVADLTTEQLAKIFKKEITNWKDVGGNDAEVVLIGREAASGTRDGFESITGTKDKCQYRQELTSTGDVITAVSQNPDAIGYASLASIKDTVKALNVDGVTPGEATVKDGSYKVQRPFVLVTVDGKALSPAAQAFFDYATSSDAASIIAKAGAVAVAG